MEMINNFEQYIPTFELEKNPDEVRESLMLEDKVKEFCEKIGLEESYPEYIKIGYRDTIGYYAYTETDQGLLAMLNGFPNIDFADSFQIIIRELLMIKALNEHLTLMTNDDKEDYYNNFITKRLNEFYNNNLPGDIINIIDSQQEQFKRVK